MRLCALTCRRIWPSDMASLANIRAESQVCILAARMSGGVVHPDGGCPPRACGEAKGDRLARMMPLRGQAESWVAGRQTETVVNDRDYPRRQRLVGGRREQCFARAGNCGVARRDLGGRGIRHRERR